MSMPPQEPDEAAVFVAPEPEAMSTRTPLPRDGARAYALATPPYRPPATALHFASPSAAAPLYVVGEEVQL